MFPNIDFSQLTLMDALDIAILVEAEAFERYTLFTNQLGHRYPDDAASVFRKMAESEKKHADELTQQRKALFGNAPVAVNKDSIFDVEAPEIGSVRWNMSPFKAFQLVLSSEEKAYAFYDEALSHVNDTEVKALFSELHDEEAEHVRMITDFINDLPPEAHIDLEDED
ncbi:MAG: ferritin family protein [gamma proteobacterium symbiont of Bathyaustriella thionipta]|nr:ferritin family protein [gamma proteobacterium symbiont of Bathyaustriella thionipta]MCU7951279.1 ferritin family protein [gamma proteobacterium symbiont of Bathyaustriella thionipta]MCU7954967.1 ferritin family protein [gamma proteobacterium symbiont of Bathyaustriella thionipta]MCU7957812.1 ferritin family protein [gamma proteobacterium symbiont of Bathyaustriella thionipta]MCU7969016.1 ferritin family protein [gamma proteobacterium symbiont of Bathyaustriella thionipta]